jgi:hypothetical protein
MEDLINLSTSLGSTISIKTLLVQIFVGMLLALTVAMHFEKFGGTYSNRDEFRYVLPAMTMITLLVITVVKSSLALSLGLVGALSIVRFRTPIKEPEELTYLFLAIGVGLGIGANQIVVTIITTVAILVMMTFLKSFFKSRKAHNMHLAINIESEEIANPEEVTNFIAKSVTRLDLQRFNTAGGRTEFVFHIEVGSPDQLHAIREAISNRYSGVEINFIDVPRIPGL